MLSTSISTASVDRHERRLRMDRARCTNRFLREGDFGAAAKGLVGLHGILIGAGEIVGGLVFSNAKRTEGGADNKGAVVMLGFVVHCAAFFLIFLNVPDSAPFGETSQHAYITSSPYLAVGCSFALGFGDACFNTQVYALLGSRYGGDDTAAAFALFKFVQSTAAASAFFLSDVLSLYRQLLILVVFCAAGTLGFTRVSNKVEGERPSSSSEQQSTAGSDSDIDGDIVVVDNVDGQDDERQRMLPGSEESA